MQNNAIIALMQQFMPGFTMDEMEFGPEEFEAEALGMYEDFVRSRPAPKPKARKAGSAGGGSSAPRKRTKKATPRPLIELPPSYEEDGSAAAAGQLIMASAPTEILSKVFLLLGPLNSYGQLSLVNKHWREALQMPELWRDLSYKGSNRSQEYNWLSRFDNHTKLIALLRHPRFKLVTDLCMPSRLKMGTTTFKHISKACPNITYLNIANAKNCKTLQLMEIANCMPNLHTFIMGEATVSADMTEGLQTILRKCTGLKRLEVHGWFMQNINDRMLTAIAALPQLEVLLLSQGNYAGFSTFMYGHGKATDEGLLKLVARGAQSQLRSLTLKNLGSANGQELLRAAAGACPLLTTVSITGTNETRAS